MATISISPAASEHSKLAGLLRRRLRAVPTAVSAPILGAMLPVELKLLGNR